MVHGMEDQAKSWNVGVIQGNIDQSRKWDPAFQQETLRRYNYLSLQAANATPRPDLLVWPETAAPFFYGIDETLTAKLVAIIQKAQVPVLFGSLGVTLVAGQPRLQNRAYLVSDNGTLLGAYAKQHLVPFGEYVPYQRLLFFVHKLVEVVGEFVPGNNSTPLAINGHKLGVLICYEGVFPELSRRTVQKGADVLVNITNDAWYGNTSAPYQHLEIARWRSIEFRVPLVRSANSGVSAIYDASGSPLGTIPLNMEGELVAAIRPIKLKTFYAIWGDLFAWFCVIISVCGVLYSETYRHLAKSHN
jgi:apolipoprotein N-acyltransferase